MFRASLTVRQTMDGAELIAHGAWGLLDHFPSNPSARHAASLGS
ncbi:MULTISPECIES: hypothetical protein [Rhizobium]|uniref:Uncharacterized protein n=1 Tax=Rhizobium rhododendri TaxID=2506430 RepID=A0ABY8IRN0_9HYPH|nr:MULTISPECIES: hypothetical protein [Rhizobium]WFS25700.1 hypothetical protein PR018_19175 [Rhizobium rhododendri]